MESLPVVVVGGGIAGLASALALAKAGLGVVVCEQAPAFESVGAGLQIGPNAVKALQWLGAWEELAPQCVSPSAVIIRDAVTGRAVSRLPLGKGFQDRFGAPYRVAHRGDLLHALLAVARRSPRIELRNGIAIAGAVPVRDGVHLNCADGHAFLASQVIAADGIRSVLRKAIAGEVFPAPRSQILYRALVPVVRAPPHAGEAIVNLWMGRGFHTVHYPVSRGCDLNIVVSVDGHLAAAGWGENAPPGELAAVRERACPVLGAVIGLPGQWLKWPGSDLPSLSSWHRERMLLVGDAAHASLPYLAQGAAMALEDAVLLGRCWPDFAAFARHRMARTARVQQSSRLMAYRYHASGATRLLRNAVLRWGGASAMLSRLEWLYGYDPVTV